LGCGVGVDIVHCCWLWLYAFIPILRRVLMRNFEPNKIVPVFANTESSKIFAKWLSDKHKLSIEELSWADYAKLNTEFTMDKCKGLVEGIGIRDDA
jgi:hypothetical protein